MELFYSTYICGGLCILDGQEAIHCSKVLRHKVGDVINIVDGLGKLLSCRVIKILKDIVECEVLSTNNNFGSHPYKLVMAVAPTKNIDRYEWFIEKGTELGMDYVVPVIGDCSERRIINIDREEKIIVSAAKQSQKAMFPSLYNAVNVREFIMNWAEILEVGEVRGMQYMRSGQDMEVTQNEQKAREVRLTCNVLKMIAFCGDAEKRSINDVVREYILRCNTLCVEPFIIMMIGPEGDFSPSEIEIAITNGFIPVHLGESRLRTETAAVAAVSNLYFAMI